MQCLHSTPLFILIDALLVDIMAFSCSFSRLNDAVMRAYGNPILWMITLKKAKDIFVLPKRFLRPLPVMRNIPGKYCILHTISQERQYTLTSFKAAKALALKVHGTPKSCPKFTTQGTTLGWEEF
jgi:hypothetical protein